MVRTSGSPIFWMRPRIFRSSGESGSAGAGRLDVEPVVGQVVERDADRLRQAEGVVEARPRLPLEDPGDLGVAHLRQPGQLLAVEALRAIRFWSLIFEFHD